ncbi:flavin mononucleotide phosphatase [Anaerobiospirillum thomasii]|uniref:Flavin mononucleotide phosphatase n=1 Tax=Anaerobiospirillum thomasii TaxID=179995 RepID=A0A2X0WRR5_9GAMM|nr:HAD-IA family hydrolase [Anaerobiospirillum thomasii]SPT69262.1 flavin mononucleotide phosphatase [Anaerobiospirillum thomasii]SPT72172.1 flavin mononucleotide phosphatase [Anaerobiospirillum thomasii]
MIFYKRLPRLKALSFDLDDTVYDNVPAIHKAEVDFCLYLQQKYDLPAFTASQSFWAESKAQVLKLDRSLEGDVTLCRAKALQHGFLKLGVPLSSFDEALELVNHFIFMRSSNIKVDIDVIELLRRLKERYVLVAISNGNVDTRILQLDEIFEFDLRPKHGQWRQKPYSDLFDEFLQRYKLKPSEVLHVGDDPVTDVLGSVQAGFNSACIYKGYAGKSHGFDYYRALPHVVLKDVFELRELL